MRTIKADYYHRDCLQYTVNGENFVVNGEFYVNKSKDRIEHIHIGKKGGEYLIVWSLK